MQYSPKMNCFIDHVEMIDVYMYILELSKIGNMISNRKHSVMKDIIQSMNMVDVQ